MLLAVVFGACLVVPGTAAGAVTITSYKITSDLPASGTPAGGPSTAQAGANPDAGSWSTFAYPDGSVDLKTTLTNSAPGLLGNPESVPKCPEAALQAGGAACPAGSKIGSSRVDLVVAGTNMPARPPVIGDLYNAEPLGNEPGRLASVTSMGVSSIRSTITPRGGGEYGNTTTVTNINRFRSPPFPADLQVAALGLMVNASTRFVRNPTSCGTHYNTAQAAEYDVPTFVDGPPYQFGTVGCEQLPFSPTTTLELGDRGNTGFNRYPPFKVTIRQAVGEADQRGSKITLPVELNSNNPAYKLCTQEQADADRCPDGSKFGGVAAKSPFLAEELKGPVYLVQQRNTSLPGLLLDLRGRVHVKSQTQTKLINNKVIQSLVLNAPQTPVTELRLGLNGGRNTGVFINRQDLCFRGDSTSRFNDVSGLIRNYGHNGAVTQETKLKAKVNGCGPGVSGRISGAARLRPSVRIKVKKHPDAPNLKELLVTLSRNLSLVRGRFGSGASTTAGDMDYASRRSFKVTGLPAAGDDALTIQLRRGAVQVSARSQKLLARGRSRRFRAKVKQTPVTGQATSTKASFRARGSKQRFRLLAVR